MTPGPFVADSSTAGLTAQLAETWASLVGLCSSLTDAEWELATACPAWSVRDQVAHVVGTESILAGRPSPTPLEDRPPHVHNDIGASNEAWVLTWRDRPTTELLVALQEVTTSRLDALGAMTDDDFAAPSWTPIGQATYGRFMQIRVFDCWVHEQDIRAATGRPGHESGPAAEQSVDEVVRALGYLVGKKAGAPTGSRVTISLTGPVVRTVHVAVDGRAALVESLDGPPSVSVALGSTLFVALGCGRVDPAIALAGGEIELSGDVELAGRVAGALAFTM